MKTQELNAPADDIEADKVCAAIDNIEEQASVETATPAQEVVAWRWRVVGDSSWTYAKTKPVVKAGTPARFEVEIEPLYTHPAPAPSGTEALRNALKSCDDAFADLFEQCLSNGMTNAWGKRVDCSKLNEAHQLSSAALSTPTPAQPDPQQFETFAKVVRDAIRSHSSPIESGCTVYDSAVAHIASAIWRATTPAQQAVDAEAVKKHLTEARRLFGKIRGDFLDPRDWCDDGRDEIDKALALIGGR